MKPLQITARISQRFQQATIRSKIIVLIMGTVLVALFLAGVALLVDDVLRERRRLVANVMGVAQVISSNSTAAVTFRDKNALNEILASLARRPNILMACVYDSSLKVLGSFTRPQALAFCPPSPSDQVYEFSWDNFTVSEPILLENTRIGTLLIISDLREMREAVLVHALITLFTIFLAALAAFWLSRRIEHFVSDPLHELARTARVISEKGDYSIRAEKASDAEMSLLIEAFNHMLARVEEQNQEHERLLQEAQNAVRVRDEFLSIASHELRTPLTSLRGGMELIHRLVDKDLISTYPRQRLLKLLATNDQEFTRFSRLVDDLLDVTRISSGHLTLRPELVDLKQVVHKVLRQLQTEINVSRSSIALDLKGREPGMWDRFRIEQVLLNLVSNAVKYGGGNAITIATRTDEDSAVISVQDHGIGISANDQINLFQRFARAASSRHFGGLGLGLYISRQIVEAHGGKIQISSSLGEGTTITVELPLRVAERDRGRDSA
ncbi:MAG: hypothetical protein A2X94_03545 [Bdellovibrionales bacterium GWB1_55_8]|nr:MAG: hypothetical protein A2X94_03545 [Bdellovibrionales bacterium GWB1_55_8]